MAIFPFKKAIPTREPTGPALTTLNDHQAVDRELVNQLNLLNRRFPSADNDVRLAAAMEHDITARREQIDGKIAEARYSQTETPDLTQDRRALADLESRFKPVSETARAAKVLIPRLHADIDALRTRRQEHRRDTNRLLWLAAREQAASYAADFAEKEAAFRAAHRAAFVAAAAADKIAMEQAFGDFLGADLYYQLNISRPLHPAFDPNPLLPEEAQARRRTDALALQQEADQLMASLLNPES